MTVKTWMMTGMYCLCGLIAACGHSGTAPKESSWPRVKRGSSQAFNERWFDGTAEMSGYRVTTSRYGAPRLAEVVLIYVTEPLHRETLIKDDRARDSERLHVLKLNMSLRFQTGIYPYSVFTSTFSPVKDYGLERFSPAKITLTSQEWCGHVFHGVWPSPGRMREELISYFAEEGEVMRTRRIPDGVLFEDALLVQLRELDGPFHDGKPFRGQVMPSLWNTRKAHQPFEPRTCTIERAVKKSTEALEAHTLFTLSCDDYTRAYRIEQAQPHRVLGWDASDGETATLLKTANLKYWELNAPGDESHRERIGLSSKPTPFR